eukprot:CAMPEP_0114581458 /NCGR_PEP_ID=MMETSP0125-20121206/5567_1 /TAXON_ID=485358 ORGANISM="Aristerostoma sp., Strain ATCC 50986" /NCGR_SAMPLE_ID=MMETSP0125 /ASSEMBLY_ACC=CAM_ASM_000245 /LENGTH=71 /DNA_ID=CAMNT_0001773687 /DNA_START=450 /DNA_END=665 /DNA_ORIENTATION=-
MSVGITHIVHQLKHQDAMEMCAKVAWLILNATIYLGNQFVMGMVSVLNVCKIQIAQAQSDAKLMSQSVLSV